MGLFVVILVTSTTCAWLPSVKGDVKSWVTVTNPSAHTTNPYFVQPQKPTLSGQVSICTNKISNCPSYGPPSYACQGVYASWARIYCNQYCGFCAAKLAVPTTALPVPTTSNVCTDRLTNCAHYGDKTYACKGQYEQWARINCAKYCDYCHVSATLHSNVSPSVHSTVSSTNSHSTVASTSHSTVSSTNGLCMYKGKFYSQGDTWTDGCDYNCTCVDAQHNIYQCNVLCVHWQNLRPECSLDPPGPGECCQTLRCQSVVYEPYGHHHHHSDGISHETHKPHHEKP